MFGFFSRQDINKGVIEYKTTSNAVLLDVRTSDEYRDGHIPGSVNIDVSDIGKVVSVVSDKTAPLFVYCHSGSRSAMAVSALEKAGYIKVKNIGGIVSYTGSVKKGS